MKNLIAYIFLAIFMSLPNLKGICQQGTLTVGLKVATGKGDLEVSQEQLSADLKPIGQRVNGSVLGGGGESRYSLGFTTGYYLWDQVKLEGGLSFSYWDYPFQGSVNLVPPSGSSGADVGLEALPMAINGKNKYFFMDVHLGARIYPGSGASQTRFFFFPNFVASNYLSNQREQSIFLEDGTIEVDATGTDTYTNFRSWTFNTGLGLGLEFHVSRRIDISFMANLNITLNTLHKDKEHEIAPGCGCLNLNLDYRL